MLKRIMLKMKKKFTFFNLEESYPNNLMFMFYTPLLSISGSQTSYFLFLQCSVVTQISFAE